MIATDLIKSKLTSIANAIRERTGEDEKLTLSEMVAEIEYMPSGDDGNAYILVDEDGNEIPAVLTDDKVDLTATSNDIRKGSVAVTDDGVITGEKEIPAYHTFQGYRIITAGSLVKHTTEKHEYTKLQAMVCSYNTSLANSTATEKVVIDNHVYSVQSAEPIAQVTVNYDTGSIEFGIKNETTRPQILRYFYYKEEH